MIKVRSREAIAASASTQLPQDWRRRLRVSFLLSFVIFGLSSLCTSSSNDVRAQTPGLGARDTSKAVKGVRQRRPGFDLPDSLYLPRDSVKSDIDTIVQYEAKDSIVFDVPQKRMTLVDNAVMHFESRDLKAYTIVMDFATNKLEAFSEDFDSVISSSLSRRRRIIRDTARTKTRGAPVLNDAGTPYEGEVILYDFKTRRGTVQLGTTTMEGGFYYGEKIKQVDKGVLFVENGHG